MVRILFSCGLEGSIGLKTMWRPKDLKAHLSAAAAAAHACRNLRGFLGRSLSMCGECSFQSFAGWLCSFCCPDPPRCVRREAELMDVRQCPLGVFWGDCGRALKMITLQCTGLQHRVTRGGQTVQNLDFQTNRLSSVRTANTSNV